MITTTHHGLGQDASSVDPFAAAVSNLSTSTQNLFGGLGPMEWTVLLGGAFVLFAVFFTAKTGAGAVRGGIQKRRRRRERKRELEKEYASL